MFQNSNLNEIKLPLDPSVLGNQVPLHPLDRLGPVALPDPATHQQQIFKSPISFYTSFLCIVVSA